MGVASYSTVGFTDRSVSAALEAIVRAGFRQVEIVAMEPHISQPPGEDGARELWTQLASLGFVGVTVHAPLGVHVLGAPEEEWRRRNVSIFVDYLGFTAAIGGDALVIHPVPNPMFVPDAEAPDLPQRLAEGVRRSLDALAPVAQGEGVRIHLENLPYDCSYPLLEMGELRPLVDDYPDDAVGLVVDTGHAWTRRRDPDAEILLAGARLGGLHLQDVDGEAPNDDHWMPTHGDLDWDAIRTALGQVEYGGPWTFEVAYARHGETLDALAAQCCALAACWASAADRCV